MIKRNPIFITIDENWNYDSLFEFLESVNPYGIILFSRHIKSKEGLKELNAFIKKNFSDILIGIDVEGGRVNRLKQIGYDFLGASEVNENPELVYSEAKRIGEVLKEFSFDIDFAPVVDLGEVKEGTGLEGRVYSCSPIKVMECAEAFLKGLKESGIEGCLKHFPGLGGSLEDTHFALPYIKGDFGERRKHLYPFIKTECKYVMISHASYEFLEVNLPASINPETYLLLKGLKNGVISITDDLSMGALKGYGDLKGLVKKSLDAGADVAMFVADRETTKEIGESFNA